MFRLKIYATTLLLGLLLPHGLQAAHTNHHMAQLSLYNMPRMVYDTQSAQPAYSVAVHRTTSSPQSAALCATRQYNIAAIKNSFLAVVSQTTTEQLQQAFQQYKSSAQTLPVVMLRSLNAGICNSLPSLRVDYSHQLKVRDALLKDMGLPATTTTLTAHQEKRLPPFLVCAYYENEQILRDLSSKIELGEKKFFYNNELIQTYETQLQTAQHNHMQTIIDTKAYPVLEKQATDLKNYVCNMRAGLERAEKNKADLAVQLAQVRDQIKPLTAWSDGALRNQLQDKEKVIFAQIAAADKEITYCKQWLPVCKAELKKLDELLAYGKQCQAKEAAKMASTFIASSERDRALVSAIKCMHKDPHGTNTMTYAIDSSTVQALEKLGFDAKQEFNDQYAGNALQQHIHGKFIDSLNRIGSISFEQRGVQSLLRGAVLLNKTGQKLNSQQRTTLALSALHACDRVIDYAKTVADYGIAVGEGVANGVSSSIATIGHAGKFILDATTCPEEFIVKVHGALNRATIAISTFAADVRETAHLMSSSDTESLLVFAHRRDENGKRFSELVRALEQKYHDMPTRDRIKMAAQFLTEWHFLGELGQAFCEAAALQKSGEALTMADIVAHPQQALARKVIDVTINTINHEPAAVKTALKAMQGDNKLLAVATQDGMAQRLVAISPKPADFLEAAAGFVEIPNKPKGLPKPISLSSVPTQLETKISHAAQITEQFVPALQVELKVAGAASLSVVEQHPVKKGFKALVTNAGKQRLGEADYFPIKCPTSKELYNHLFRTWQKNKRRLLVGGHMPKKQPGLIAEIIKEPNSFGVREVVLEKGKFRSDKKTLGPDHWNQVDYIRYLREAYQNTTEKSFIREGVFRLAGRDQKGIMWHMYIELQDGSYKLTTGYPIYE